jgi:hypothetical protein
MCGLPLGAKLLPIPIRLTSIADAPRRPVLRPAGGSATASSRTSGPNSEEQQMIATTYGTTGARKRRISTLVLELRARFERRPGRRARSGPLGVLRILKPRTAVQQGRLAYVIAR